MSNLTVGIPPKPYGKGGRKILLPVKASAQIYEGALVSEISGAAVVATTSAAGAAIGVAMHDILGGASDGTKRVEVLTDQEFLFTAGSAAPTDATPKGSLLFLEDDHTVGTGGLGATQQIAGRFRGIEDDGLIRVFVSPDLEAPGAYGQQVIGTALTDTATTTVQRGGRVTSFLCAGTMSQGETITLGTTGAVLGDIIRILRTSTSAQTLAVVNGGAGAGTIATLPNSKVGFVDAYFDGTNWLYFGASPN